MTFLLISSFAAVMITTATRGHRLTRNINIGCNKLLLFGCFFDEDCYKYLHPSNTDVWVGGRPIQRISI